MNQLMGQKFSATPTAEVVCTLTEEDVGAHSEYLSTKTKSLGRLIGRSVGMDSHLGKVIYPRDCSISFRVSSSMG